MSRAAIRPGPQARSGSGLLASPIRIGTLGSGLARRLVSARLQRLEGGRLTLREAGTRRTWGEPDAALSADLQVRDPRFWRRIALGGSIGAGISFSRREWDSDDLVALLRLMARNEQVGDALERGWARLTAPARRLLHRLRRNSRSGSRRNIAAHYDLGNEFYSRFLDDSLMYSSAVFPAAHSTLEQAARHKLDLVCRKLELGPDDHLLEIGTGWGGLALHAAGEYGCRVTTTTISRQQALMARSRIQAAGLADRVTVLEQDYRDLPAATGRRFSRLVSIEMVEAVGARHFDTFMQTCGRLLTDDGLMLLQAIVIADHRYEAYRRSVDFIQYAIFPGGCLPSVAALTAAMARRSDLRLLHMDDIGPHYARTLRHWRRRFLANRDDIADLGYDDAFLRLWEFYLAYCEAGFSEQVVGDVQMLLGRPRARRRRPVPETPPC